MSAPVKLWIVGARGMLGCRLQALAQERGVPIVATDVDLDITDYEAVSRFAHDQRPTHIVNCAAYTRVDDAESHQAEAHQVNTVGAENLAKAAANAASSFLTISTDYVFDGNEQRPYLESDECNPQSVYGQTKFEGERRVVATMDDRHSVYVVRTSWLFGENGKNFVSTMLNLMATRNELRVVADQTGRPTYTSDLAAALLALTGLVNPGRPKAADGIYHFANSGDTTWHGFACAIHAGAKARQLPVVTERVLPVATSEYPTPTRRPAYSVLSTEKITGVIGSPPRPWLQGLDDYLDHLCENP